MDLEEYVERITGIRVDFVSKKGLKPRIGGNILKEVIEAFRNVGENNYLILNDT
jgi:predicted nucleotidyltransferase